MSSVQSHKVVGVLDPLLPALTGPAMVGISRLSATDTVRARIELAIELNLLVAGEKLPSDSQIAEALDVSVITARRALESLSDDGILSRRRGRRGGTFVTEARRSDPDNAVSTYRADAQEVHRLIDQRVLIETALVHHAALIATEDDVMRLEAHVAAAASASNWTEYHGADERFHRELARVSGLAWALPHYSDTLSRLYKYFIPYPIEALHRANEDHSQIVEELRHHDPVAAVAAMSAHVQALHTTMFVGYKNGQNADG